MLTFPMVATLLVIGTFREDPGATDVPPPGSGVNQP